MIFIWLLISLRVVPIDFYTEAEQMHLGLSPKNRQSLYNFKNAKQIYESTIAIKIKGNFFLVNYLENQPIVIPIKVNQC